MSINISYYISEVEKLMTDVIKTSAKKNVPEGKVDELDIKTILLNGVYELSKKMCMEIHQEIVKKEGYSWSDKSNEMRLMSMGVIFCSWASWVFKAKSEDAKRNHDSINQAACVNKYLKSIIDNAIIKGIVIGEHNKRPENTQEYMNID